MDYIAISAASVFWFIAGLSISAMIYNAAQKELKETSEEFEKRIRQLIAEELKAHATFKLGVPLDSKKLREIPSEVIGFNLGLHTAGIIINSNPGEKLTIVEKINDDGDITYDVEQS